MERFLRISSIQLLFAMLVTAVFTNFIICFAHRASGQRYGETQLGLHKRPSHSSPKYTPLPYTTTGS
ncbi:uncharacterized protein BDR25DRAFT_93561 [Lindgomyces ingoldianus]|uniref:Uncharacterized protein n=1 Tax=Lindgomyces ingoldianus TaxID=673940 RepID=A0ACB6QD37_9PLEO|nr:uncharacterized protein BDR25DRAFT_93561 [Lindgomyces ingoldianus]KAF2464868.1 hypothetical protein BDR25DRAFT_93561 [Lindgomyces ingoldianus]